MRDWRFHPRLSLRAAAHILGLNADQVRQLVERGELEGETIYTTTKDGREIGTVLVVTSSVATRFDDAQPRSNLRSDAQRAIAWATNSDDGPREPRRPRGKAAE